MIHRAMELTGVIDVREVLAAGDTRNDRKAARNAGVRRSVSSQENWDGGTRRTPARSHPGGGQGYSGPAGLIHNGRITMRPF
ncbi:hypothetical protein AB4Z38_04635 [Arthrobacter sp. 2RAF6]|uniref:hypothetical protein n=1 Tax=Arthrobacter sp. 2RAF6 TaxID=3233002 RepID=UPI003F8EE6DB